jgi:hypothetical protein
MRPLRFSHIVAPLTSYRFRWRMAVFFEVFGRHGWSDHVVHRHDVRLAGIESDLLEDRHQRLAGLVERRL